MSAGEAVKAIQPEGIVVKFDSKVASKYKGTVLTSISGGGHAPYALRLATFRIIEKKIKVFVVEYQGPQKMESSLRSTAPTDTPYPESEFYYEVHAGELDYKKYSSLVAELGKIHQMRTFKEYSITTKDPISFEATEKEFIGNGSYSSKMSTSSFVSVVNLWDAPKKGFLYEVAGYPSTELDLQAIKVVAMNYLINDIIQKTALVPIKVTSSEHRDIFYHQWAILKLNYNSQYWSWVKERTLALASILGDHRMIKDLIHEFKSQPPSDKSDKEQNDTQKNSQLRLRRLSATALAKISGKDFRFDKNGVVLPIEQTGSLYLKEFPNF